MIEPGLPPRKLFFRTLGRLPKTWWIVSISVLAGLAEGFGLTLFVPLVGLMGGEQQELSGILGHARRVFAIVGLPFNFGTMLACIILLVTSGAMLTYMQRRALFKVFNSYSRSLRTEIVERLFRSSWPFLAAQSRGEIVVDLVSETNRVSTSLMMQINLVTAAIQVVVLGGFSAALSLPLVIVVAVFGAVIVVATIPYVRRSNRFGAQLNEANRAYGFHVIDYLSGSRLIKVMGAEEATSQQLERYDQGIYRRHLALDLNSTTLLFIVQVVPIVLLAAIVLIAHYVLAMTAAGLLTFLVLIARIAPRIGEIQQRYEAYVSHVPPLVAIDNLLEECRRNEEDIGKGRKKFAQLEREIRFESVSFQYPNSNEAVIRNVDLVIPRNGIVALVGTSGAGKSTLINLLTGLYRAQQGRITIDGSDIRDIDLLSWRRSIGYVTQEVITFNDTIRNNVMFAHPEATEADIANACRIAHFDKFVETLERGFETEIGENGVRLSGGQRQRLALARALIGRPQILLLDEATSALDNETERAIQNAIDSIASSITMVVVAHRLSTVRRADLIAVLESGQIVEMGTYDELLACRGRFAELHAFQFAEQPAIS